MKDYKLSIWKNHHYRFGLAGEGQADIIAKHFDRQRGDILNVGCGPRPQPLKRMSSHGHRLIAIDLSLTCLQGLRAELVGHNIFLIAADASHLPLADGSVDHVVGLGLFVYIREPHLTLMEFRRVLRPNGLIMLSNSVRHDPAIIRRGAEACRLRVLDYHEGYCPSASGPIQRRHLFVLRKAAH